MDELLFNFRGGLADTNRMDFYEAARFQYAAARLSVKLDQFRRTGKFPKRVTTTSRTNIDLHPYKEGSFQLKVTADESDQAEFHVKVPLTTLWTYIIERVFQPTETSTALDLIDDTSLRSEFFDLVNENIFDANDAISVLRGKLESDKGLTTTESHLLDRLVSEVERRSYLQSHRDLLANITAEEDAALVTMATPLLSELAVPLRRSAKRVMVTAVDALGSHPILMADKESADALELIKVDKTVSTIDVNIVQYNKESGWGKFRNPYWEGIPSFSVPADRKDGMRFNLLHAMRENSVSVDAYFVRSVSGEPIRIILVDLRRIDEDRAI